MNLNVFSNLSFNKIEFIAIEIEVIYDEWIINLYINT